MQALEVFQLLDDCKKSLGKLKVTTVEPSDFLVKLIELVDGTVELPWVNDSEVDTNALIAPGIVFCFGAGRVD